MKAKILFALSIFCVSLICKAQQSTKPVLSLCDYKPSYISKTCLSKIFSSSCSFLNYKDAQGNTVEITGYTFVHADTTASNPYYENVSGNSYSDEIKSRILNAKPGDMLLFVNVECTYNGLRKMLNGADFFITE